MANENSGNVLPSEYCCHLFDFAKMAKIYKFRFANSWFDSPMATWRTLTGTLTAGQCFMQRAVMPSSGRVIALWDGHS